MKKYTYSKLEKELINSFSNYTLTTPEARKMYRELMNSINTNAIKRAEKREVKNVL